MCSRLVAQWLAVGCWLLPGCFSSHDKAEPVGEVAAPVEQTAAAPPLAPADQQEATPPEQAPFAASKPAAPHSESPAPAIDRAAAIALSRERMETIGVALHEYMADAATFSFPPAVLRGSDGQSLLSWRVQILPYVGQKELFEQFRLDEPWDSPHNQSLIGRMPDVFRSPLSRAAPDRTNYVTIRGDGTAFPADRATRLADFADGSSNTILFVECSDKAAPVWTRPDDLPHNRINPVEGLPPESFLATFADGRVHMIPASAGAAVIDALITPAGREAVDVDDLQASIGSLQDSAPTPVEVIERFRAAGAKLKLNGNDEIMDVGFDGRPVEERLLFDLFALDGLRRVESISLTRAQLTDNGLRRLLELLPHPERLTKINLSLTRISDQGMEHLKRCPRLSYLGLDKVQVTDEGLSHLKGQTEMLLLDLSSTKVTDAGLKHLSRMKELRMLLLTNTRVTERGVNELRKALPELEDILY